MRQEDCEGGALSLGFNLWTRVRLSTGSVPPGAIFCCPHVRSKRRVCRHAPLSREEKERARERERGRERERERERRGHSAATMSGHRARGSSIGSGIKAGIKAMATGDLGLL